MRFTRSLPSARSSAPAAAEARFDAALRLAREHGKRSLEANALFQLGRYWLVSGDLGAGQERFLETLRLAADLGLAVNTVARAYRELEQDGVVTSHFRPDLLEPVAGGARRVLEPRDPGGPVRVEGDRGHDWRGADVSE